MRSFFWSLPLILAALISETAAAVLPGANAVFEEGSRPLPGESNAYLVKFKNYYRPGVKFRGVTLKAATYYRFSAKVSSYLRGVNGIYIQIPFGKGAGRYNSECLRVENQKPQEIAFTFRTPDWLPSGETELWIFGRNCSPGLVCRDPDLTEIPRPAEARLILTSPAFRNGIYHSRPVKTIAGRVECYPDAASVKIELRDSADRLIASSAERNFSFAGADRLGDGAYTVRARFFDAAGKEMKSLTERVIRHPAAPAEIVIGEDNNFYRNGRPFYPLLVWANLPHELRAAAARFGVNVFMCIEHTAEGIRRELELARQGGYMLLIRMTVDGAEYPAKDGAAYRKRIEPVLTPDIRAHQSLFGYIIWDEPTIKGKPLRQLQEGWRELRNLDPYHPAYQNGSPGGTVEQHRLYSSAADIYGMDVYPVGRKDHGSIGNPALISCVGETMAFCVEVVEKRKPISACLQAFAWSKKKPVYPDRLQNRFMAYDSFFNGVKAIGYWGTHRIANRDFVRDWFAVLPEIARVAPVFGSGKVTARGNVGPVRYIEIEYEGKRWLFAVNYGELAVNAELPSSFADGAIPVRFEGRSMVSAKGRLYDSFRPWETHVYGGSDDAEFGTVEAPEIWLKWVDRFAETKEQPAAAPGK